MGHPSSPHWNQPHQSLQGHLAPCLRNVQLCLWLLLPRSGEPATVRIPPTPLFLLTCSPLDTTLVADPPQQVRAQSAQAAAGATTAGHNSDRLEERCSKSVQKLGALVTATVRNLRAAPNWETFVRQRHGPSHLRDDPQDLPHPVGPFPASPKEHGVPVAFDNKPWSLEEMDRVIKKGCHPAAQKHASFITEEMLDGICRERPLNCPSLLCGQRTSRNPRLCHTHQGRAQPQKLILGQPLRMGNQRTHSSSHTQ